MILVTGGLGFIGLNVARALLDVGESCVLTQHRTERRPSFIQDEIGSRILIEHVDIDDTAELLKVGEKHEIRGIVHLGGSISRGPTGPFETMRSGMIGLSNVFQAAQEWNAKRVLVASTIGVYGGVTSLPWREDAPIACTASMPIEALKKASEIFAAYIENNSSLECINIRIAGIYGPLYDATRGGLAGRLVHAALNGTKPSLEHWLGSVHAEDGMDLCYVKDGARAIALLQVADKLHYRTYNVASGRPTTNQQVIDAIKRVIPEADLHLPSTGKSNPVPYQDITRLHDDTGFEPRFSIESGIADYIAWLRAGNEQ